MKGRNSYIFYTLITVAVMAIALFVPSLRLPTAEADISSASADSVSDTSASDSEDGNSMYVATSEEGSPLTYPEKIRTAGATIAGSDGYSRKKIENSNPDKAESLEQFKQIIQKLYENNLLDETTYNDLLTDASVNAITEYSYTKNSNPLFTLRIIERTYYNVSFCSRMAISVGLDRDTGGVIYLYLNFYGLYEKVDVENSAADIYWTNWPGVLGFTNSFSPDFSVELETSNSLRIHAKYQLSESSAIYYKFGFSYESNEDRYQIFIEPAVN